MLKSSNLPRVCILGALHSPLKGNNLSGEGDAGRERPAPPPLMTSTGSLLKASNDPSSLPIGPFEHLAPLNQPLIYFWGII